MYNKEYYETHKASFLKAQKAYNERNKVERAEYYQEWYDKNRDKKLEYQKEYNHRTYVGEVREAKIMYQRVYRRKKMLIKLLEEIINQLKNTKYENN